MQWAIKKHGDEELGGEYCVWVSERMNFPTTGKQGWAAVCTCTACQEDFITQKEPGMHGIRMILGDDGSYYSIEPWEQVDPYMGIEVQRDGDEFYCPYCGSKIELIHKSKLGGGRTKRIMVISLQNVQGFTTLMYWMVQHHVTEDGISTYGVTPEEAYVLTEHAGLKRYTHVRRCGAFYGANRHYLDSWHLMANNTDVIDSVYPDWGSINNKKCGADIWPVYPSLEGATGEKTAVEGYLMAGGYRPVEYLKWWRKRRNIENLCRQGQAKMVVEIIREVYRYSSNIAFEADKYLDLSKKKPHEMLRITKADFRWLREHSLQLEPRILERWNAYQKAGGKVGFTDFLELSSRYGAGGANAAIDLVRIYGHDMDKVARYLEKQNLRLSDAGVLLDTRKAYREFYNRELTSEELWPKRLHDAHDRVYRMLREQRQAAEQEKLLSGFQKVLDSYGHLQWSDGDLTVILPKNNGELVREGDVLRHCVGGYGKQHISGSSVIFFIRHYRRPERPYYTLAINMTGDRPRESQLHGYGNERHGMHKEHSHSIPKKVRDFCTRWENEILLPWHAQEQARKQQEAKTA